MSYARRRRRIL